VSPGGFYGWRGRPPCLHARRLGTLVEAIRAIHHDVKARYGSPRMHAELVATGNPCSRKAVAKLMRRHGIAAKTRRRFCATTVSVR
jgi:putative transposase